MDEKMDIPIQVPFHRPSIGREEIEEVVRTMQSGWLTTGPRTAQFEQEFRTAVGASYSLAVNSCTAGLHLALAALNIAPGMEVITTPLTFCATVNVILHAGATPVLADVAGDGNIDPGSIAERITSRTRAIIPVHLAGLPCDMAAIWDLARRNGLMVIEDAAHAAGARYRNCPIGGDNSDSCTNAAVFSFYATKNMTTGEGGMITTHDQALANSLRILCLHGISKDAWNRYSDRGNWYYEVLRPGFKFNLSDIQSAIGIHQLRKLEAFIEERTRIVEAYNRAFEQVEELEIPPNRAECRHAWHLYMLRLNTEQLQINRDQFIVEMRKKGIGTSVHFIPVPLHPFFSPFANRPENQCPNAITLYQRLISLPLFPGMTDTQTAYVIDTVKHIVRSFRRKEVFAAEGVA
jgi:dTDP-4-amino-4,6-dideoxygalactose transaminase